MDTDTRFELVIFDCDGVLVDSEHISIGLEAEAITILRTATDRSPRINDPITGRRVIGAVV